MAVVINEMEVVVEQPAQPAPAGQSAPQNAPAVQFTPADIDAVNRRLLLYHARVAAH